MIPQAARFAPELNSGGRRSLLQNTGCERTDGRFKPGNSQSVKPPNLACVKILICGRGIPERAAPHDGHTEGCWCRWPNTLDTSTSPEPMARPAARASWYWRWSESRHETDASTNCPPSIPTIPTTVSRPWRKPRTVSSVSPARVQRMLAETKPPAGPSRCVCDVADPGGSTGFRGGAKGSFIKLHNV